MFVPLKIGFFAAPLKNVPLKKFMLENVSFFENRFLLLL